MEEDTIKVNVFDAPLNAVAFKLDTCAGELQFADDPPIKQFIIQAGYVDSDEFTDASNPRTLRFLNLGLDDDMACELSEALCNYFFEEEK